MLDWITNAISSMGYLGIALLMLLENFFPPVSEELIMPLAGFTVQRGELNFLLSYWQELQASFSVLCFGIAWASWWENDA
jgi:membrane protein DedA with SNARE-associated domain